MCVLSFVHQLLGYHLHGGIVSSVAQGKDEFAEAMTIEAEADIPHQGLEGGGLEMDGAGEWHVVGCYPKGGQRASDGLDTHLFQLDHDATGHLPHLKGIVAQGEMGTVLLRGAEGQDHYVGFL